VVGASPCACPNKRVATGMLPLPLSNFFIYQAVIKINNILENNNDGSGGDGMDTDKRIERLENSVNGEIIPTIREHSITLKEHSVKLDHIDKKVAHVEKKVDRLDDKINNMALDIKGHDIKLDHIETTIGDIKTTLGSWDNLLRKTFFTIIGSAILSTIAFILKILYDIITS